MTKFNFALVVREFKRLGDKSLKSFTMWNYKKRKRVNVRHCETRQTLLLNIEHNT